jgi:hypothetical protein
VAQQRLPVRKILEVLRLKTAVLSDRKIAAAIGSARSTVPECLRRAREAGMAWPLAQDLNDEALHARLYERSVPVACRPQPDFAQLHAELARAARDAAAAVAGVQGRASRRLAVQRFLRSVPPVGLEPGAPAAAEACARREPIRRLRRATIPIVDRHTGEARPAQIFVAPRLLELHLRRSHLDASAGSSRGFATARSSHSELNAAIRQLLESPQQPSVQEARRELSFGPLRLASSRCYQCRLLRN